MSLKFQNSKSDLSCKIEFYIFLLQIVTLLSLEVNEAQWQVAE